MSKDAYYFSHDSNARNDVRMIKLRRMGGLECVGLFWCIIEMLRESKSYTLDVVTIEDICYELRIDVAKFELLFICELLTQNDDIFYSKSLMERMVHLDKIREQRAIAGQKGGKSKANAKQLLSNKRKEKESKIKKEKIPKRNFEVHPRIEIVFTKWLEYKQARRETYKTPESTELALKKLVKFSDNDPHTAKLIIEDAMSNNYAGFFELKPNTKPSRGGAKAPPGHFKDVETETITRK